ncbi:hypothetical protein ACFFRR_011381 [Megaselia abdita]
MNFALTVLTVFGVCAVALGHVVPPKAVEDILEMNALSRAATDCVITVRSDKIEPQPLYLVPNGGFWPINGKGQMVVGVGKELEFFCPSKFAAPFTSETTIKAKCVDGKTFKVGSKDHSFSEFKCGSWPSYTAKKIGGSCPGGILLESGFNVGSRFVKLSTICFNEQIEATRYVQHSLVPGSDFYQTAIPRVTFVTAGFFGGKNVDNLYTQKKQQETITKSLGYDSSKFFDEKKSLFLARGHLAAKADFIMGSPQRGTFLFVNAGPQWQSFNAGNWQRVEDGVRSMVTKRQITIECYTGTYGVTTLPNKDGKQTELYLYESGSTKQIPVPKIYFRIVYEPSTKKAIVLIGVNNPHLSLVEIKKDYILCPDISSKVTYVGWSKTDIIKGYSYACEYAEFKKKVTNIPSLTVSGVFV